jgi:hypothetical protein
MHENIKGFNFSYSQTAILKLRAKQKMRKSWTEIQAMINNML